jgi:phage terminase large subunit GpA-like protein
MLVVQPTTNVAKRWSKQRFAGMIRETPSLRRLVQPVKSRDSGNTTLLKEFPGGVAVVGGANSAPDLASMPIKYLALDEIDRYPYDDRERVAAKATQSCSRSGARRRSRGGRSSSAPRRRSRACRASTRRTRSRTSALLRAVSALRRKAGPPVGEPALARGQAGARDVRLRAEACGALIAEHEKTAMLEAANGARVSRSGPSRGFT